MHVFPWGTGTNYHRVNVLKQQKLFFRAHRSEVQQSQGVSQPALTLEALIEKTSLLLPASGMCPHLSNLCLCVHIASSSWCAPHVSLL